MGHSGSSYPQALSLLVERLHMNVTQIASVAAAFEAARMAGIQQAGSSAAAVSVQRESNRAAAEADVRKTQAVQETDQKSGTSPTNGQHINITV